MHEFLMRKEMVMSALVALLGAMGYSWWDAKQEIARLDRKATMLKGDADVAHRLAEYLHGKHVVGRDNGLAIVKKLVGRLESNRDINYLESASEGVGIRMTNVSYRDIVQFGMQLRDRGILIKKLHMGADGKGGWNVTVYMDFIP